MKLYRPFPACTICKRLPQKFSDDERRKNFAAYKKYVLKLDPIVSVEESPDCCAVSRTLLFKCSECGTYYYYNHYEQEGHYPHHTQEDDLAIRRYDPIQVREFLSGFLKKNGATLPSATGQLKNAFAEGRSVSNNPVIADAAAVKRAKQELRELAHRYGDIKNKLVSAIQKNKMEWHGALYAIQFLCKHFIEREDFQSIKTLLLDHADPVIRAETALYLINIATENAPVTDLIHLSEKERRAFKKIADIRVIIDAFFDVLLSGKHTTYFFDHGYGQSAYYARDVRITAMYGLEVVAGKIPLKTLREKIPHVLDEVLTKQTAQRTYDFLKDLIETRKAGKKIILDAVAHLDAKKKSLLCAVSKKIKSDLFCE